MNVGFTFNVKRSKPSVKISEQKDLEYDSPFVIETIEKTLQSLGHKVYKIEANEEAYFKLKELKDKLDIVFTIAEGVDGDARESQIPILCEILGIPYTHSSPTTHAIGLNKEFTKLLLKGAGAANVPGSMVINSKDYEIEKELKFPLIIKPNKEGSSKGVLDKNVVHNESDLAKRIKIVSENFKKEVLVEEFIDGREFTVSVIGNDKPQVLPIVEQKFDFLPKGLNRIASFELKWIYEDYLKDLTDAYDCPAKLTPELKAEIDETSIRVYKKLNVKDCSRIDYRLNSNGKLYFIEINTLPGIIPGEDLISYFPLASRAAGLDYKSMVNKILTSACTRYGIKV